MFHTRSIGRPDRMSTHGRVWMQATGPAHHCHVRVAIYCSTPIARDWNLVSMAPAVQAHPAHFCLKRARGGVRSTATEPC
jgi:hypothetical protein